MTLEKTIEKYFTKAVRNAGGMSIKLTDEQQNGLPDRLILLPNGVHAFAEIKAPGKKPRELQKYRIKTLEDRGHRCFIVDTKEKADEVIREILTT